MTVKRKLFSRLKFFRNTQNSLFVDLIEKMNFICSQGERIEIVITVPMTSNGGKVLGNLIDHFDFVINESFHGISPQFDNSNKTLFDANAVCPHCISELRMDPNSLPTLFPIEDLANKVAQDQSETTCNLHPDYPLSISSLAPDLTMSDFSDLCKKLSIDVSS